MDPGAEEAARKTLCLLLIVDLLGTHHCVGRLPTSHGRQSLLKILAQLKSVVAGVDKVGHLPVATGFGEVEFDVGHGHGFAFTHAHIGADSYEGAVAGEERLSYAKL